MGTGPISTHHPALRSPPPPDWTLSKDRRWILSFRGLPCPHGVGTQHKLSKGFLNEGRKERGAMFQALGGPLGFGNLGPDSGSHGGLDRAEF